MQITAEVVWREAHRLSHHRRPVSTHSVLELDADTMRLLDDPRSPHLGDTTGATTALRNPTRLENLKKTRPGVAKGHWIGSRRARRSLETLTSASRDSTSLAMGTVLSTPRSRLIKFFVKYMMTELIH